MKNRYVASKVAGVRSREALRIFSPRSKPAVTCGEDLMEGSSTCQC
jgi:hypothetical protein